MFAEDTALQIGDGVYRIGGDDRTSPIFEGMIPVPEGVSFNSYLIDSDGKTALLDTVDISIAMSFWRTLRLLLDGRSLDYLVIHHMEPDHGACISQVLETWPEVTVVGNQKIFDMLQNYYRLDPKNKVIVNEGDELQVGKHTLRFFFAPMVHWPEVMISYDVQERKLFSADAFGTFKALAGNLYADEVDFDNVYLNEARRYYSNICGKYGPQVQKALAKLKDVPIEMICPLHGPMWRKDLGYIIGKYDLWSRYQPEDKGVVIAFTSIYGNTEEVANRLAILLKDRGVEHVVMHSMNSEHLSYALADMYRFTNFVLAAPTYNNGLNPTMAHLIDEMEVMAVQGRRYSLIANGSWVPQADKIMEQRVSAMKDMTKVGETLTIKSSIAPEQIPQLEKLADDIVTSMN